MRDKRRDRVLGYWKLILLAITAIAGVWILAYRMSAIYWLSIPVVLFVLLSVIHERVIHALRRCTRVTAFYEAGLARIGDQWPGAGETGDRFSDAAHPYARDLDLFGKGSLFELLCTARTRAGEETLAQWLLAPAPPEELRLRHDAIWELREKLDLREDLAVLGERARAAAKPELLAKWGEEKPLTGSQALRVTLGVLAILWIFGALVWAVWDVKSLFLVMSLINFGIAYKFGERAGIQRPCD